MKATPPKRALNFLRWFCREDCLEEIEGDLTEIFQKQYGRSAAKAKRNFMLSVFRHFRPAFIKSFKSRVHRNSTDMIRHNILITYRTFLRYKSSFLINLTGLTTGLACALLIWLWVYDEISIDKFHLSDNRLYQVLRNIPGPLNTIETSESNSALLPPALTAEMPEVEYVVPLRPAMPGIVTGQKEGVRAIGMFAGKDFFNAFTYRIVAGNRNKLLAQKEAMVISDALAVKLFGSPANSIGKTVMWDVERQGGGLHIVSGVFRKPEQSSMEFDFLTTHDAFLERSRMDQNWYSNPIMVYLTLKDGVEPAAFNIKLNELYRSKREDAGQMFLQRFSDRYLYGHFENGRVAGGR
jgi:putative ABC transport system permease protein